jgi:hypothetical protein
MAALVYLRMKRQHLPLNYSKLATFLSTHRIAPKNNQKIFLVKSPLKSLAHIDIRVGRNYNI